MGLPEAVYEDEWVQLYQGDALALLPELPAASVQLIIVDPPYFKKKLAYLGHKLAWDRQWKTRADYLAWLKCLALEWQRLLTPNGSLYCFADPGMAAHVEVMLEEVFTVLNRITWLKDDGWHQKACKEELRAYLSPREEILFCEQQDSAHFLFGQCIERARKAHNLSRQEVSQQVCGSASGACWNWEAGIRIPTEEHFKKLQALFPGCFDHSYNALIMDYEALRRPFAVTKDVPYTDCWDYATVPYENSKHPCEKPMALLQHMITVSSRPGDLILDPTAGSGSTLDAARALGRRAIGFELEASSCQVAYERLRQQRLW